MAEHCFSNEVVNCKYLTHTHIPSYNPVAHNANFLSLFLNYFLPVFHSMTAIRSGSQVGRVGGSNPPLADSLWNIGGDMPQ